MTGAHIDDPLGVLESRNLPLRSATHFDIGDGWQVILNGEEVRRPRTLLRVAITRVEITFDSEANLSRFLEVIKDSDSRLSQVPDSEVMYDWQIVRRKDLIVRFGVAWYDQAFFAKRKEAHRSTLHQGIFQQFGVLAESIRVEHIPL